MRKWIVLILSGLLLCFSSPLLSDTQINSVGSEEIVEDAVGSSELDTGTGAGQVNTDTIPQGVTNLWWTTIELNARYLWLENVTVFTPTANYHPATKKYVDDEIGTYTDDLRDNSMADTLHRHSELSASDGTPDAVFAIDADGNVRFFDSGNDPTFSIGDSGSGGNFGFLRWVSATDTLNLGTTIGGTWNDQITLLESGKVGIGTASPDKLLEVDGDAGYVDATDMGATDADFASKKYVDDNAPASGTDYIDLPYGNMFSNTGEPISLLTAAPDFVGFITGILNTAINVNMDAVWHTSFRLRSNYDAIADTCVIKFSTSKPATDIDTITFDIVAKERTGISVVGEDLITTSAITIVAAETVQTFDMSDNGSIVGGDWIIVEFTISGCEIDTIDYDNFRVEYTYQN